MPSNDIAMVDLTKNLYQILFFGGSYFDITSIHSYFHSNTVTVFHEIQPNFSAKPNSPTACVAHNKPSSTVF